eukprot:gnl/MRDRNA2_/MRDRNA2_100505_c0_seq1.p1 gnl/MRDRNA2_/MRDRNA2_100505_c0~~gnl/MRDRNA2_/MRDRNA2_100505_c0_seq1.p1  ORF type:complete len:929 (-),score=194.49 gnl/MRDRNA2_/MRDRNA2_100505_c0_seq1:25-2811(-)
MLTRTQSTALGVLLLALTFGGSYKLLETLVPSWMMVGAGKIEPVHKLHWKTQNDKQMNILMSENEIPDVRHLRENIALGVTDAGGAFPIEQDEKRTDVRLDMSDPDVPHSTMASEAELTESISAPAPVSDSRAPAPAKEWEVGTSHIEQDDQDTIEADLRETKRPEDSTEDEFQAAKAALLEEFGATDEEAKELENASEEDLELVKEHLVEKKMEEKYKTWSGSFSEVRSAFQDAFNGMIKPDAAPGDYTKDIASLAQVYYEHTKIQQTHELHSEVRQRSRESLKQGILKLFRRTSWTTYLCTKGKSGHTNDVKKIEDKLNGKDGLLALGTEMDALLAGPKLCRNCGSWWLRNKAGKATNLALKVGKKLKGLRYCQAAMEDGCYHLNKKPCKGVSGSEKADDLKKYMETEITDKNDKKWKLGEYVQHMQNKVLAVMFHTESYDEYVFSSLCRVDLQNEMFQKLIKCTGCQGKDCDDECLPPELKKKQLLPPPSNCNGLLVPGSVSRPGIAWHDWRGKCAKYNGGFPDEENRKQFWIQLGRREVEAGRLKLEDSGQVFKKATGHPVELNKKIYSGYRKYEPCLCKPLKSFEWKTNKCSGACLTQNGHLSGKSAQHWYQQQRMARAIGGAIGENCKTDDETWYVKRYARLKIKLNLGRKLRSTLESTLFPVMFENTNPTMTNTGELDRQDEADQAVEENMPKKMKEMGGAEGGETKEDMKNSPPDADGNGTEANPDEAGSESPDNNSDVQSNEEPGKDTATSKSSGGANDGGVSSLLEELDGEGLDEEGLETEEETVDMERNYLLTLDGNETLDEHLQRSIVWQMHAEQVSALEVEQMLEEKILELDTHGVQWKFSWKTVVLIIALLIFASMNWPITASFIAVCLLIRMAIRSAATKSITEVVRSMAVGNAGLQANRDVHGKEDSWLGSR